jgi:hypothetical protein
MGRTGDDKNRRLRHESKIGDPEPADAQAGDWPRAQLLAMNERFVERVEHAIKRGERAPSVGRRQMTRAKLAVAFARGASKFCNDFDGGGVEDLMIALDDGALARVMIAATAVPRRRRGRWLPSRKMMPATRTSRMSNSPSSCELVTRNGVTTAAIMMEDPEVGAETACRVVPNMA